MNSFFTTYREHRLWFFLLGAILLAALIIRCYFFVGGVRGTDAYLYAEQAQAMASGSYQLTQASQYYEFRLVMLLPTALSYYLFGINDYSSALLPLIFSLLNIVMIFLLAEKIFDWKTACLASLLMAIYPLDIMMATTLSPDSLIPLFSTAAIYCYVCGLDQKNKRQTALLLFLSGVCIVMAASARITSFVLFFPLVFHQLFLARQQASDKARVLLITTLGMTLPFLAEMLYAYINTGDFLFRIHQLGDTSDVMRGNYQTYLLTQILYYPRGMFGFTLEGLASFGLTWWLAVAGLFWAVKKRLAYRWLLILWLAIPLACNIYIAAQAPQAYAYRLLSIIAPVAIISSAYLLSTFTVHLQQKKGTVILFMLLLGMAGMNFYGTYRIVQNRADDDAPYIAVADALKEAPCRDVYASPHRWPTFLDYYLRYNPCVRYRSLDTLSRSEMEALKEGTIILHNRYISLGPLFRTASEQPFYASYLNSPPAGWTKIFSYTGEPAYNSVVVYEIGD